MPPFTVGLQLYTVRDQLDADYVGTLRKVREIGYTHVELAGHGPYDVADLKKVLDDAGLTPTSDHCPIDRLEKDIHQVVDEANTLGIHYVVCPWLPDDRRTDEAAWRGCAESLNTAGRALRNAGLQLCYHNHSFEFVRLGDRYAFDLLYDETEPDLLQAELDTYWVRHGGEDPLDYLRKLAGRCPILHLKDMADDADRSFAAVGTGILDFPAILEAGEAAGVVVALVEQDVCPGDPLESVATSLRNLQQMGYA
jgi:sugar phosphate isomerase/epimerase